MNIIANKRPLIAFLAGMCLLCLCLVPTASAFEVPERLEFSIWWGIVKAGNSVLEISQNGDDSLKVVSRTKSSKFLSLFYKVEDRLEVNMEEGTLLPFDYYLNLREGGNRKEKRVTFDREYARITLDNIDDKTIEEFQADGDVYDPLSAFYKVRTMDLEVGETISVRVFDNGKLYDVDVEVLSREEVRLPHGTFNTIKIKPVLKSEGIFMRKGDVIIWVTDDDKKVPVKVESKVKVGSIHVELRGGQY